MLNQSFYQFIKILKLGMEISKASNPVFVRRGGDEGLRREPRRVGRAGSPQGAPVPVEAHVVKWRDYFHPQDIHTVKETMDINCSFVAVFR